MWSGDDIVYRQKVEQYAYDLYCRTIEKGVTVNVAFEVVEGAVEILLMRDMSDRRAVEISTQVAEAVARRFTAEVEALLSKADKVFKDDGGE